ncbi:MAG: lytic transglycosylase domain-containing protein [Ruminococcus sp.]|nr:lytic transglycosylase domain-containing protein [Ruminococcus sp.]
MAQRYRRKKRRKSRAGLVVLIAAVTVAVVGAVVFVVNCYGKTETDLRKLNYPREYSDLVSKAAKDYNLSESLIYAVIRTESNFHPNAESAVGARGLMQLMPSSFEWLTGLRGETGRYTADDLFTPSVNIDYGSYLLRYFYDYYGTEQCAVAAYNAGFVVSEWLENPACSTDGKTLTNIPYPETAAYVVRVEEAKAAYEEIY